MRKNELSFAAILAEAACAVFALAYVVLQIYYGVAFYRSAAVIVTNIIAMLLVYAILTALEWYPERVNRLPEEVCQGRVRVLTLRMLRFVKIVFCLGLLIPCIYDAVGKELPPASSLILILLMLLPVVYYEARIIGILRKD